MLGQDTRPGSCPWTAYRVHARGPTLVEFFELTKVRVETRQHRTWLWNGTGRTTGNYVMGARTLPWSSSIPAFVKQAVVQRSTVHGLSHHLKHASTGSRAIESCRVLRPSIYAMLKVERCCGNLMTTTEMSVGYLKSMLRRPL
jgi:hypothetical protein